MTAKSHSFWDYVECPLCMISKVIPRESPHTDLDCRCQHPGAPEAIRRPATGFEVLQAAGSRALIEATPSRDEGFRHAA